MNLQSMRNVYRNRGRPTFIVTLPGVSLMFVASMTSLSTNSQKELATVHQLVGAGITVKYPSSDNATPTSTLGSSGGGGQSLGNTPTPIPNRVVMNTDLTPIDERDDEELEAIPSRRIIDLLKDLAEQGKTVIVVTHDRTIARSADVCLELSDGRLKGAARPLAPTRTLVPVQKRKGKKK